MTTTYKTLRKIDGIDYIELKEHEDILQKILDFQKALDDVRSAVNSVTATTEKIGGSLRNLVEN